MQLSFDEILRKYLGEFGRYQKGIYLLLCLPSIAHGVRMMISVFLLNMPDHRCAIPGYDNDTFAIQSEYHAHLINDTIPYETREHELRYDHCHIYVDGDNVTTGVNRSTSMCHKWVYDRTLFENTVATDLNFVCDDSILGAHSQMIFMAGYFIGAFATGFLGDKLGRKKALYLCNIFHIVGGITLTWSSSFAMFVIIRFINGAASGGAYTIAFVMCMEFVGPSKRTFTGIMIEAFFAIGMTILSGASYFIRNWHTLELSMSIPLLFFLSFWWLVPESPRWLMNESRDKEAEVIIRRAADVNKVILPEKLFEKHPDDAKRMSKEDEASKGNFFQLFTTPVICIRTIIIFINWFVVSMVYYGLSLNTGNLGAGSLHLNFLLVGLVEFPACFIAIMLLDRLGRKIMHCASMILSGVSCILTIFTILYAGKSLQWLTVLLAMIGKLGASSAFAIIYVFSSELFPTVIRNSATGASSSWARAGGMIAPYIVDLGLSVGGSFGRALPLLMFGSFAVVAGLLALLLPETLNRDLPETIEDGIKFGRQPPKKRSGVNEDLQKNIPLLTMSRDTEADNSPIFKNNKNGMHQ